jgi:hypothetical protein
MRRLLRVVRWTDVLVWILVAEHELCGPAIAHTLFGNAWLVSTTS